MKTPKRIRRETAKEITAIASVLAYVSGFLYALVDGKLSVPEGAASLTDEFGIVGGIIASIFAASGAQHVTRERERRLEKKDADEAGRDDGAGSLHASDEEDAQA